MQAKQDLVADLSAEDIAATLEACGLEDRDKYTDEEADRFRDCRALIQQDKSYKDAAQLLQEPASNAREKRPKSTSADLIEPSSDRAVDMPELERTRDELLEAIAEQSDWEVAAQAAAEQVVGSFLTSFQFHLQRCMAETTLVLQQRQAQGQQAGNDAFHQRIEARVERLFGGAAEGRQLEDGESNVG